MGKGMSYHQIPLALPAYVHGIQKIIVLQIICKMSPTLPQIIKSCGMENDHDTFKSTLSRFNTTLHSVRCQIDSFFVTHSLFVNL